MILPRKAVICMKKLTFSQYAQVSFLFSNAPHNLPVIISVLDGNQPGMVFADDVEHPTIGIVVVEDMVFIGGNPEGVVCAERIGSMANCRCPRRSGCRRQAGLAPPLWMAGRSLPRALPYLWAEEWLKFLSKRRRPIAARGLHLKLQGRFLQRARRGDCIPTGRAGRRRKPQQPWRKSWALYSPIAMRCSWCRHSRWL